MSILTGNDDIDLEAAAIRTERERLAQAQRELDERTRALVLRLRPGIVVRRVAAIAGISPARVSQIELAR